MDASLRALIAPLFEAHSVVVAVEQCGSFPLFPDEERVVEGAVASRRHEFAAGRAAARRALAGLGWPPSSIPSGEGRAPVWPAGVVGSISHAGNHAVAAVARASEVSSLGIDLELARPLPADVARMVVTAHDRLGALPLGATIAFSAKESVYKALYPAHGFRLEFADVALELHAVCSFTAIATFAGKQRQVRGRFSLSETFVATAVLAVS